ncbi:hypothetical protein LX36DRAFT_750945 [Colletotrichum falcatum]|nr:hypothetical protein LX36DRAFT_750945 [Colletotrichum falcatum]
MAACSSTSWSPQHITDFNDDYRKGLPAGWKPTAGSDLIAASRTTAAPAAPPIRSLASPVAIARSLLTHPSPANSVGTTTLTDMHLEQGDFQVPSALRKIVDGYERHSQAANPALPRKTRRGTRSSNKPRRPDSINEIAINPPSSTPPKSGQPAPAPISRGSVSPSQPLCMEQLRKQYDEAMAEYETCAERMLYLDPFMRRLNREMSKRADLDRASSSFRE